MCLATPTASTPALSSLVCGDCGSLLFAGIGVWWSDNASCDVQVIRCIMSCVGGLTTHCVVCCMRGQMLCVLHNCSGIFPSRHIHQHTSHARHNLTSLFFRGPRGGGEGHGAGVVQRPHVRLPSGVHQERHRLTEAGGGDVPMDEKEHVSVRLSFVCGVCLHGLLVCMLCVFS